MASPTRLHPSLKLCDLVNTYCEQVILLPHPCEESQKCLKRLESYLEIFQPYPKLLKMTTLTTTRGTIYRKIYDYLHDVAKGTRNTAHLKLVCKILAKNVEQVYEFLHVWNIKSPLPNLQIIIETFNKIPIQMRGVEKSVSFCLIDFVFFKKNEMEKKYSNCKKKCLIRILPHI